MNCKQGLFIFFLGIFVMPLVAAQCAPNLASNTQDFLADLSSANTELSNCPIDLPAAVQQVFGDGIIQIEVAMNSGTTESFSVTISNNQLAGVGAPVAKYNYLVLVDESTADSLISSQFSNFFNHYANGDIKLKGGNFINSIKLVFVKIFGTFFLNTEESEVPGNGQPEDCHETYLPGWQEYSSADIKEQWDSYTAQTDGVCQFDVGTAGPQGGDCAYVYQTVKGGASSWLCWYNE